MIMNSIKPVLSIIIPCFNHPEELKVMVDSIKANTFSDWELLLVDDGSEEETLEVERAYALTDKRIHALRRDVLPKGAQTCRNMGLAQATGKYVCFFDSDDYIIPQCLEQRIRAITAAPDVDFLVFPTGTYIDGKVCNHPKKSCFGYKYYTDDIAAFCEMRLPFIVCSNIYRRQALVENNILWDTKLVTYHDELFNLLCLTRKMKYAYAAEAVPDYAYRIHMAGSTSKQTNTEPYLSNSLYAMEWRFKTIHETYGKRYDRQLYHAAWHTWLVNSRHGRVPQFTQDMKSLVKKYSPRYGAIFGNTFFLALYMLEFMMGRIARNLFLKTKG